MILWSWWPLDNNISMHQYYHEDGIGYSANASDMSIYYPDLQIQFNIIMTITVSLLHYNYAALFIATSHLVELWYVLFPLDSYWILLLGKKVTAASYNLATT